MKINYILRVLACTVIQQNTLLCLLLLQRLYTSVYRTRTVKNTRTASIRTRI